MPDSRIRKWTEENLKHSKELKLEALAAQKRMAESVNQKKSAAGAVSLNGSALPTKDGVKPPSSAMRADAGPLSASLPPSARTQKRTRESDVVERDEGVPRPRLGLQIPDTLKARLIDDWQWTTKDERLVPLPRQPTVAEILQELRSVLPAKRRGSAAADNEDEVFNGLLGYFDKCLGTILLYRFERQQYADIRRHYGHDARMSEIYGVEHLLRLLGMRPRSIRPLAVMDADRHRASIHERPRGPDQDGSSCCESSPRLPARSAHVSALGRRLRPAMANSGFRHRFIAQKQSDLFAESYDVTAASYSRMLNYQ